MLTFWIMTTGLTLLALAFIVPPLMKKNVATTDVDRNTLNVAIYQERLRELEHENLTPEQLAQAKQELEKNLAQELEDCAAPSTTRTSNCWVPVIVAIGIPVLAMGSYFTLGAPQLLTPATGSKNHASQGTDENLPAEFDEMVAGLAARLEQQPDDLKGWQMLARSYAVLGDHAKGVQTYNQMLAQFGEQPPLIFDFAEFLAKTNDGKLAGLPSILLKHLLNADPNHQNALFMLGIAAKEQGEYNTAIDYWERLAAQLSPDAVKIKQILQQRIGEARQQLASAEEAAVAVATTPETPSVASNDAGTSAKIEVHVSLSPALQAQVEPSDTLFIYARATKGPRMPLVMVTKTIKRW